MRKNPVLMRVEKRRMKIKEAYFSAITVSTSVIVNVSSTDS